VTATPNTDQPAAPAETPRPTLNRAQQAIVWAVAGGAILIAGIGFAGSYRAVTKLAVEKGFGTFAYAFPIGIDAGIVVLLALDLVLTWLRVPFAALRYCAWGLTGATIAFNAAAAWGDNLAVAMHATIPALFVIVVEAARHAVGRIANITAGHQTIEAPPWQRWILDPIGTFIIWRRQRVWQIPSYLNVIEQQRDLRVFRAQLRKEHGRGWRRSAPADKLLVFKLARFGISVSEALARPEVEAEAQRKAEVERAAEVRRALEAEAEALRVEEARRRDEAEALRLAEAETEARLANLRRRERLAEAEVEEQLASREQQRIAAEAEAELARKREALELAKQEAEVERRRLLEAEESARRTAEAEAEALRVAQERLRVQAEALRKLQETPRTIANPKRPESETPGTKSKPEPEAANRKSKQPTEITGRRARIEAEVETLLALMKAEGPEAVNLKRVMDELSLSQTTAYDRLQRAQEKWAA
jgi:hypothetical protein